MTTSRIEHPGVIVALYCGSRCDLGLRLLSTRFFDVTRT